MNKLVIDKKLKQQKDRKIFLTLKEDIYLTFQNDVAEVYLVLDNDLELEIEVHTKVKLYIFNWNHSFTLNIHVKNNADITSYVSLLSNHDIQNEIYLTHEAENTKSNLFCHGISYGTGKIKLLVNGIVPRGKTGSVCNQTNHLINLDEGKGIIEPNLLIDEYDVNANHAAYIGPFALDSIFYLQTKGLLLADIYQILSQAFLYQGSQDETYRSTILNGLTQIFNREVRG